METNEIRFGKCIECRARVVVSTETHLIHGDGRAQVKPTGAYVKCPNCPTESVRFTKVVRATLVPSKACDSKCAMATSENCKCSCGGSAHGRGAVAAHLRG